MNSTATAPIYLVDDDDIVREVAQAILEEGGHRVRAFRAGKDLVEAVAADGVCPGCLVLDYAMPGLNGLQTLEAVRKLYPEVGAVVVTGHAEPKVVEVVEADPRATLLTKPYSLAAFLKEVARFATAP